MPASYGAHWPQHRRVAVASSCTAAPEEAAEGMDSLGRPISRRRWGSRKKRFSSAYSDSSMSDGGEVSLFADRIKGFSHISSLPGA